PARSGGRAAVPAPRLHGGGPGRDPGAYLVLAGQVSRRGDAMVWRPLEALLRILIVVAAQAGDPRRLARRAEDVHPRVGAVDDVDETTAVDLDVVGLDDHVTHGVHA